MKVSDMLAGSVADISFAQIAGVSSAVTVGQQKFDLPVAVAYWKLHGFEQIGIAISGGDYIADICAARCVEDSLVMKIH